MSTSHRAMPETQLDVDLLILDYLLYMGTRASLQEQVILHEEGIHEDLTRHPLRMLDAFLPVFKCNHPAVCVPDETNFRLRLIKFTTLFSKRNVPCEVATPAPELEKLRRKHNRRAEEFYGSSSDSSFSESLFEKRMSTSSRRPAPKPSHDEEAVSLADLVPMFVGLSAARVTLFEDDRVSAHEGWMDLAGEFMLQAALEQCLEYSDCSGAKLRGVFSWGWRANPKHSWEDEDVVNNMFCDDEESKENESWAKIRSRYIELLRPKSNTDLAKQLRALTRRYPIDRFEERILRFMEAMQLSLELPILAQLDTGTIAGMTQRQVQELKKRITLPSS